MIQTPASAQDRPDRGQSSDERRVQIAEADRLWSGAVDYFGRKAFDRAFSDFEASLAQLRRLLPEGDAVLTGRLAELAEFRRSADQPHESGILLQEAIDGLRRAVPPRPRELARCLKLRGSAALDEQDHRKAKESLVEAAIILRAIAPPDANALIDTLMDLSNVQVRMGEFAKSDETLREAIGLLRRAAPPREDDLAECLQRRGGLLMREQKADAARPLLEEASVIWRRVEPSRPSERVGILAALSWIDRRDGRVEDAKARLAEAKGFAGEIRDRYEKLKQEAEYLRALPVLREDVEIAHILNPEGHPEIADRLIELAELLDTLGKYSEEKTALEEALGILRSLGRRADRARSRAIAALVKLDDTTARFDSARDHLRQVLPILGRLAAEEPEFVGATLSLLGETVANLGQHGRAMQLVAQGSALLEANAPDDSTDRLKARLNLALMNELAGNGQRAEQLIEELRRATDALPPRHAFRVAFGDELVRRSQVAGRLPEAEAACRTAIKLAGGILPPRHPELALLWNRLGNVRSGTGDLAGAEAAYREARRVVDENLPIGHPTIALIDFNLANLYAMAGRHKPAKVIFESVLRDRRATFPPDHPDIASTLDALAGVHQSLGEFDRAEGRYREALAIYDRMGHRGSILVKNNLATLLADRGDLVGSGKIFMEALSDAEAIYPVGHQIRLEFRERLFSFLFQTGQTDVALDLSRDALRRHRSALGKSAAFQSERQELLSVFALRGHLDNYLSAAHARGIPADEAYGEVVTWKGIVTYRQEAERRLRLDRASGALTPADVEDLARLRATVRELEELAHAPAPPGRADQDARRRELQDLADRREEIEMALRGRSRLPEPALPDAGAIRAALAAKAPDAALVDFLEHQFLVPQGPGVPARREDRISAFVVRPDRPVAWVDLGPPGEIREWIDQWRDGIARGLISTHPASQLRARVWDRIKEHLQGVSVVLVSPDGDLARLPLAALPAEEDGKYLIHQRAFVIVPTPAKLPELLAGPGPRARGPGESLLLVGDIDYDTEPVRQARADLTPDSRPVVAPGDDPTFSPLPNARAEMDGVRGQFLASFPTGRVTTLDRAAASKAAYAQEAPRHRWQHLATHGFFAPLPPRERGGPRIMGELLRSAGEDPGFWNPALMSGLALAGANRRDPRGGGGAILTALAVAEMDLAGVEMVTLAECETGLGKVADGEGGVLGLQRAFQIAGARSVVASYWKVGDRATREFVLAFYRNLWGRDPGISKVEAFRKAQIRMIETYRPAPDEGGRGPASLEGRPIDPGRARPPEKGETLAPFYWSGFSLSGDWR